MLNDVALVKKAVIVLCFLFLLNLCLYPLAFEGSNPIVHATTYAPTVHDSYAVNDPSYSIVEDGNYAVINGASGYLVLNFSAGHNISMIRIKLSFGSSGARMDMSVSNNDVNYFQVCNEFYEVGGLHWVRFPLSSDRGATLYVKIEDTGSGGYLWIDSILSDDTPRVYNNAGYYYPAKEIGFTSTVAWSPCGNIGYLVQSSPYYITPLMTTTDQYIDLDLVSPIQASGVYLWHSRATGSNNIYVLISSNYVNWTNLGASGAGNMNYTFSGVVRYLRMLVQNGTGDNYIDHIGVKGVLYTPYFLTIGSSGSYGATNPVAGTYGYQSGVVASIEAIPVNSSVTFKWWLVGGKAYRDNPISITMSQDWTYSPVYDWHNPATLNLFIAIWPIAALIAGIGISYVLMRVRRHD